MFNGIDVNVVGTPFHIDIVAAGVFIKTPLPNATFGTDAATY